MSPSAMDQSVDMAIRILNLSAEARHQFVTWLKEDSDPEMKKMGQFVEEWLNSPMEVSA